MNRDSIGTAVSSQRYLPFGEVRGIEGLTDITQTDLGYTGQRNYAGFGLMDYNARFYSTSLGRFTQPDTVIPGATVTQSWNRYSYVSNSPIIHNDPTGHYIEGGCGFGGTGDCGSSGSSSQNTMPASQPSGTPTPTPTPTPGTPPTGQSGPSSTPDAAADDLDSTSGQQPLPPPEAPTCVYGVPYPCSSVDYYSETTYSVHIRESGIIIDTGKCKSIGYWGCGRMHSDLLPEQLNQGLSSGVDFSVNLEYQLVDLTVTNNIYASTPDGTSIVSTTSENQLWLIARNNSGLNLVSTSSSGEVGSLGGGPDGEIIFNLRIDKFSLKEYPLD